MKRLIAIAILSMPMMAHAWCTSTSSIKTCHDSSGNTVTVQQYGNTTRVDGSNGYGSWNQTSVDYGNTTHSYGTSIDGNQWSGDSTHYGSHGFDSNGNAYDSAGQYGY